MYENASKVSIYVSTFNRLDKLKRAINSVFAQDYDNWELLVCDDASSDGTENFMNSLILQDERVKYFRNNENRGACYTRNVGIKNATGYFITGLDDDDEFSPNRLSLFVLKWDDKYSFSCADFIEKFPDGHTRTFYNHSSPSIIFSYKNLLSQNCASNQIFTLRRRLVEIGGFDVSVKRLQDWDTWLKLSYKFGDFIRYNTPLYIMNHDHVPSAKRVSTSYPFNNALFDLLKRNEHIYGDLYINRWYELNYLNKSLSFKNAIRWAYIEKNMTNFFRYFKQIANR
ncbi:glycosyl transferase family 2 [Klebsiella quasipneumoniae]|nr:glycosyltransferase [Klebsiella quasipneumoniae]PLJ35715.1 glycosyl transferase family 2 [Klebsiella quasipneumoniae]PLJ64256.1 glycosyl transferase family 2 [Klebsiella quasipneumoniae]HCA9137714.1 glycosyltransferase [Klebsiella quasipneumoniae]